MSKSHNIVRFLFLFDSKHFEDNVDISLRYTPRFPHLFFLIFVSPQNVENIKLIVLKIFFFNFPPL